MPLSLGRTTFIPAVAVAIVAGSFFVTLNVLDYLSVPSHVSAGVIHIVSATYGKNCDGFTTSTRSVVQIKNGNATGPVSKRCDGAKGSCDYVVDLTKLGDFAPGCGKDFSVDYHCGANSDVRTARLAGKANGKAVQLLCP
jgi:hypothetical protein